MKDKEKQTKVLDILDKMEFFQEQRAGRELWNDKPKEVQDKDISDFIKDINYIRSYLQDSVVLSREELSKRDYEFRQIGYDECLRDNAKKDKYIKKLEHKIDLLNAKLDQASKETAKEILIDLYFNLQSSVQGKVAKSNDYYNVDGWIKEIAKEYGVEVEE